MSAPPVGATREEEPAYTAGEAGGTFTVVVELPGVLAAREVVVETDARAHGGGARQQHARWDAMDESRSFGSPPARPIARPCARLLGARTCPDHGASAIPG